MEEVILVCVGVRDRSSLARIDVYASLKVRSVISLDKCAKVTGTSDNPYVVDENSCS